MLQKESVDNGHTAVLILSPRDGPPATAATSPPCSPGRSMSSDALNHNKPFKRAPRQILALVACLLVASVVVSSRLFACPPAAEAKPESVAAPHFAAPSPWADAHHLIMVAGHAVYTADSRSPIEVGREESWFLEPFQCVSR